MQDLRSAFRNLARLTGFATVAVITLAVVDGLSGAEPGRDDAVVRQVLAAHEALSSASERLDTDAFFAGILASDETRIIQDGRLFGTRAEAMEAVRSGSKGVARIDRRFNDPHVAVLAPDAALLTADGTAQFTLDDGRTFSGRFAVSLVFVLRDGCWKLLHGHYSIPNPQP